MIIVSEEIWRKEKSGKTNLSGGFLYCVFIISSQKKFGGERNLRGQIWWNFYTVFLVWSAEKKAGGGENLDGGFLYCAFTMTISEEIWRRRKSGETNLGGDFYTVFLL